MTEELQIFTMQSQGHFQKYLHTRVAVITNDKCHYTGKLIQYDNYGNVTLTDAKQVFYHESQQKEEDIGTLLLKGQETKILGSFE